MKPSDDLLDRLVAEATVRTARSSGPGGQHANVTASRVEVALDLDSSQVLEKRTADASGRGTVHG